MYENRLWSAARYGTLLQRMQENAGYAAVEATFCRELSGKGADTQGEYPAWEVGGQALPPIHIVTIEYKDFPKNNSYVLRESFTARPSSTTDMA